MSDVSAVTSHFSTAHEGFLTTLGSSILSGAATVPLTSTSGLTNGNIFVGIIEPGLTREQTFTGVIDTGGSQITGVKWTRGTNADHSAGVTIVDYVTGTGHNMMTKGISVEHNQDGTHKTSLVAMLAGSQTVSGTKTFSAPPRLTGVNDSSGNELLKFTATGSAVNELTEANAATGNGPTLTATGDDANIWWKAAGKGTGFFLPQIKVLSSAISSSAGAENVGATITVPSIPFACTILMWGFAYADLGNPAPTVDWQHRIRRGTTTAGTQIAFGNSTKSAATGIGEQRTVSMNYVENIAASTSTSYVYTVTGTAAAGMFMAIVVAQ